MTTSRAKALKDFARWVIENSAFQGVRLDGYDVQEKASSLGLLRRTKFDPAKHGQDKMDLYGVDTGDCWYEFTELLI